jgi:uncharacterized protein
MEMERRNLLNVLLTLVLLVTGTAGIYSQDFPDKPVPPRLVNDFAGLLSSGEVSALENKLVVFNDSTSTQITM